ncbi:phosphonate ABC transporter ATP-binding protein [Pseudoalteromonas rubra]|uniref:Phosphonate ABC transporter ATP-binding protein n=1 Tax=Pseudoalteromonas rubra TaxID=43658 RepID=A0A5S3WG88_9GAMM|nr:ABC transporter ATP-binding protein [Pseudoalteromonas rubra]TMP25648.1 phosphonate ABC transporter ATP-binding protein [Pseudoalteromonas rubra]TMP27823.1 phosphonate ABC transporter ATP-binding protein [Pseudoalteromonas rubra]
MIKLNNVSRSFIAEHIETVALDKLSLSVSHGEFISILGPSGCGKSSLLNILGMLDDIDEGSFVFNGTELATASSITKAQLRKKHIGFIFQNFNLIDELTVEQNIALPLHYQQLNKAQRTARVEEVLHRLDIAHRRTHLPAKLSGGQQQRVAIARAIVTQPDLILADEPTGNLDSQNSTQVMEILRQLNMMGTTIVMVTHAQEQVQYGTRVIRLMDGKIQQDNPVSAQRTVNKLEVLSD